MAIVTKTGIVILSGGKSSRLGMPKQLLDIQGKPLLKHIVDVAIDAANGPVVVITGAHAHKMPVLENVEIVHNDEWEEGMASSIRTAVRYIQQRHPKIDGLIILVSDQPYLKPAVLTALVDEQRAQQAIAVASRYQQQLGTPVLFHKLLWDELLLLKGDVGAKKLLQRIDDQIATISFEEGIVDIDTLDDYESFNLHAGC